MKNIRLSVVIPVYNAAKYLDKCIKSIIGQDIDEIEVICVDDCSTDSSAEILSKWQGKDNRIKILSNTENLGAGLSRNKGLEIAKGTYVLFMDADDELEKSGCVTVLEDAERYGADIVRCRAWDMDDKSGAINAGFNSLKDIPKSKFNKKLKFTDEPSLFCRVCIAPWGGVWRREFLLNNNIRFNSLKFVNDRSFFAEAVFKAEMIVFVDTYFLRYRVNVKGSLVDQRALHFESIFKSIELIYEISKIIPRKARARYILSELYDLLYWTKRFKDAPNRQEIKQMSVDFINNMDKSLWITPVEKMNLLRWKVQMNSVLKNYTED